MLNNVLVTPGGGENATGADELNVPDTITEAAVSSKGYARKTSVPVTASNVLWMLSRPPYKDPLIDTVEALIVEGPVHEPLVWLALSRRTVLVLATVNELLPYAGAMNATGVKDVNVPKTVNVLALNRSDEANTIVAVDVESEYDVHCTLNKPARKLVVPLCVIEA